ncbi:MAG: dihydrofolate reductase [Proteobacteria bacterium]|nr:dihydrofolate reductase [Pseudomonadota bacterium]NCW51630.1 dihydrofolate reductase [Betaproteobacteria bacterium]
MSFERRSSGICLIVAHARQRVIGCDGAMPWQLPEDLRHFRAQTLNASVVMGRKTFEAIGKGLPQRRNIVITRSSSWQHQGVFRASNLLEAFDLAGAGETYVIGGGQIYALALAFADRAVVTEIELDVPGDAYFPELPKVDWHAIGHIKGLSSQGLVYRFIDYRRTMT